MKACLVRLLLLFACALGGTWPAWAADPPPVGFETREFVDESRSNWQNTGHRPLSTVIWYPAAAGSPLSVPQVGDPAWRPSSSNAQFAVAGAAVRAGAALSDRVAVARVDERQPGAWLAWGISRGARLHRRGRESSRQHGRRGTTDRAGLHGTVGARGRPERAAGPDARRSEVRCAHRQEPRIRCGPFRGRRDGHHARRRPVQRGGNRKVLRSPTTARDSSCEPRELISEIYRGDRAASQARSGSAGFARTRQALISR